MLELSQIASFFPENLRHLKRNLLREYLQYKVLETVFRGQFGRSLVFMGGTAIHVVHGLPRFSEDLDFDNCGLKRDDFITLAGDVARKLSLEGYAVEAATSFKGAFSAGIKFPGLLFSLGLSGHKEEQFFIKLDTEPQRFAYDPERVILNKFDVVAGIAVVPAAILLAQKYYAILGRKRAMGRDFYDAMFLAGMTSPDFGYLRERTGITDQQALGSALLKRCTEIDFTILARDLKPFLYRSEDAERVMLFKDLVEKWKQK